MLSCIKKGTVVEAALACRGIGTSSQSPQILLLATAVCTPDMSEACAVAVLHAAASLHNGSHRFTSVVCCNLRHCVCACNSGTLKPSALRPKHSGAWLQLFFWSPSEPAKKQKGTQPSYTQLHIHSVAWVWHSACCQIYCSTQFPVIVLVLRTHTRTPSI